MALAKMETVRDLARIDCHICHFRSLTVAMAVGSYTLIFLARKWNKLLHAEFGSQSRKSLWDEWPETV